MIKQFLQNVKISCRCIHKYRNWMKFAKYPYSKYIFKYTYSQTFQFQIIFCLWQKIFFQVLKFVLRDRIAVLRNCLAPFLNIQYPMEDIYSCIILLLHNYKHMHKHITNTKNVKRVEILYVALNSHWVRGTREEEF